MNEIKIWQEGHQIFCNFDDVQKFLDEQLEIYNKMVFTEESKKDAKQTIADLRKMKKEFEDRIKSFKKEFMIPLEEFLEKAHALSAMFDKPIVFIGDQIDAFEKQRVEEKVERIKVIYAEMVDDEEIQSYIPLNRIYNVKWENTTYTEKAIKQDLLNKKTEVKEALQMIRGFNTECEEKALEQYMSTLDLQNTIKYIQRYEEQKKEILENQRRQEEERIRQEERRAVAVEQAAQQKVEQVEQAAQQKVEEAKAEVIEAFIPEEGGEEKPYNYTIFLTDDAKQKLETFMDSVGIEYLERR